MRRILARVTSWSVVILSTGIAVLCQAPTHAADSAVLPPAAKPQLVSVAPAPNQLLVHQQGLLNQKGPLFRHSTYPVAWTAAQKSNRPILVYVSMPNCPHCVKMVEQTYHVPKVEELVSGSFETIKADRYRHAKLVSSLQIKWYPTTVLVGPNNKVLDVIEGYVDAKQFQQRLQTGLATLHKPATTQTR